MPKADTIAIKRPEELDADMTRASPIDGLRHLPFTDGSCVVRLGRDVVRETQEETCHAPDA